MPLATSRKCGGTGARSRISAPSARRGEKITLGAGVFETVFPEVRASVVEELRWLMGCLESARDLGVSVTQTLPHIVEQLSDNRALARLQADAAKFHDTCRQAALEAVLSQRYTRRLVLTLGL
ncbi:MAG: CHAD domain-containing protein [Candidatus Nitrotoga sp. SPKER]|nr:MAG: CHAD domain-containing protein [Candidatus Nitrotoga sp. SPKER]